jgi:hypothetical protein
MVQKLIRNRLMVVVTLTWLAYWPIITVVEPAVVLEFINGIIAAMSVGLIVAYSPGIWRLTRRLPYQISGADMLVLGVTMVQLSLAALFAWGWWYRYLDHPDWMVSHAFRGWMTYMLLIGSALHLLASDVGVANNSIPERGWVHLGIAVFVGLAVGVCVITFVGRYW